MTVLVFNFVLFFSSVSLNAMIWIICVYMGWVNECVWVFFMFILACHETGGKIQWQNLKHILHSSTLTREREKGKKVLYFLQASSLKSTLAFKTILEQVAKTFDIHLEKFLGI